MKMVLSVFVAEFNDITLIFPVSDSDQKMSFPIHEYTKPGSKYKIRLNLCFIQPSERINIHENYDAVTISCEIKISLMLRDMGCVVKCPKDIAV